MHLSRADDALDEIERKPLPGQQALYDISRGPVGNATAQGACSASKVPGTLLHTVRDCAVGIVFAVGHAWQQCLQVVQRDTNPLSPADGAIAVMHHVIMPLPSLLASMSHRTSCFLAALQVSLPRPSLLSPQLL